ncbi:hypothetical protein GGI25_002909 [Coemansia spiralis]|uniref:MIR domain-containing protein n=2 Tax=Coemansia TaxID=4863 RepID=A0A9W8G7T6_9FUNG|nr:MIR motif-containing protein [Coemansia spiralis]KAJ1992382.1 hypothetical protein EDC05_002880 [Coemansia umbellata]KAJ2622236.1 hypothetical protein GGI26_003389 [Coemansia sp. RSA 1358]KAJ2677811.1 hypothetical protein GGI25_002909 [Coemansia spiralis]
MHLVSLLVSTVCMLAAGTHTDASGIEEGWQHVTSGSTVKLAHSKSLARLTMPQVSYGTGSQQQAITAQADASLTKAFWLVELHAEDSEPARGSHIPCGAQIRLVNSDSSHSLHSHSNHKSPISGGQEVSGYDGRDNGDLWTVECADKKATTWRREAPVYLRHVDTKLYLQSLPNKKYGHPITGHQEVSAGKRADTNAQWMALEGFYYR